MKRVRTLRVVFNPGPCAKGRKPVSKISDRAKRYRANADGCRPPDPRICEYCGADRNVGVHHRDGNESNGRRSNLGWACKSCNGKISAAMKAAGRGVRTRQYNPPGKKGPSADLYGWAVSQICSHANQRRGLCSPSNDAEVLKAVGIIRATSPAKRREYSKRAARVRRGRRRGRLEEVPF